MRKYLLNDKKNKLKKLLLELTRRRNSVNNYDSSSMERIVMSVQRLCNELKFIIDRREWNGWIYKGLFAAGLITSSLTQAQQTPVFETGNMIKAAGNDVYLAGGRASVAVADIDGDGDLELVAGMRTSYTDYDNGYVANPKFTVLSDFDTNSDEFSVRTDLNTNNFTITSDEYFYSYANPSFVDIDGDGDQDLVAGDYTGKLAILKNDGNKNFTFSGYLKVEDEDIATGNFTKSVFADIDGDGDMDMLVGERHGSNGVYQSQIHLYINSAGQGNTIAFDAPSTILQANNANIGVGITGFHMPAPYLVDYDGDGDLDLFVGLNTAKVFYFENVGSSTAHSFSAGKEVQLNFAQDGFYGSMASPVVADIDGDGDLDLLVGFGDNADTSGVMYLFKGIGSTLGINDLDNNNFKIYPNPVSDVLHFNSKITPEQISVYNIAGQKVLSATNSSTINVSSLSPGTYVVSSVIKGKTINKKIIKK